MSGDASAGDAPAGDVAAGDAGSGARAEGRSLGRLRIATVMVVDDSSAIRRILRRQLEGAGYAVVEAADGRQAIDACRAAPPDLMLLDMDMPVLDGPATLSEIRADDELSPLPVLFLTARTGAGDVAAGFELGAQDYLKKPCDAVELAARVAAALRQQAGALRLLRKAQDADRRSTIDPLTSAGNRRCFDLRVDQLRTASSLQVAGIAMVDVDHFKTVNDTYGHWVGDTVLRILAARLTSAVGQGQLLVRWGGEEFVVLAPDVAAGDLADLAGAMWRTVRSHPFALGDGTALPITISVGCALGPLGELDATVQAADEALYDAKRSGRDRVCGPNDAPRQGCEV